MRKIPLILACLAIAKSAFGATGRTPNFINILLTDTIYESAEELEHPINRRTITTTPPPPPPPCSDGNRASGNLTFTVAEQMPRFRGNMNAWIASHLQYPAKAAENGEQGRVFVRFLVEKDGSITNASVILSVEPDLDREALRLVNSMPRWIPGMNNGEAAAVWYTCPITFKLQ